MLSLPADHVLHRAVPRAQWEAVARGGSDPTRVIVDDEALSTVVAGLPGFEATDEILAHPLFRYAFDRDPQELDYRLLNLDAPIIQITVEDWLHREWFDLTEPQDSDDSLHRLKVDWREYTSLDRLFVLVRALEAAKRAGEHQLANHLDEAWRAAAEEFGKRIGLSRRSSDTWHWFIEQVLDGPWWPTTISESELDDARRELALQHGEPWLATRGHEAIRRRKNEIEQRALARRTRFPPFLMVLRSEPRWRWLVMHRDLIARHVEYATEQWWGREPTTQAPDTLHMPESLARMREDNGPLQVEWGEDPVHWSLGQPIRLPSNLRCCDAINPTIVRR